MAIEKKLIHFGKLADFEAQLTAGNILDYSIVFIQDAKKIWTHGTYYDCSEGTATGDIVQSDWNESDSASDAFVKNRTHYANFTEFEIPSTITTSTDTFISCPGTIGKTIYARYTCDINSVDVSLKMDANDNDAHQLGFGPVFTIRRGVNGVYVSGTYDASQKLYLATGVLQLGDIYIPDTVVRTDGVKTINGESILGEGDIAIGGGEYNVQSDWNVSDSSSDAYVKNRTHYYQIQGSESSVSVSAATIGTNLFMVYPDVGFLFNGHPYSTKECLGQSVKLNGSGPTLYFTVIQEGDSYYVRHESGSIGWTVSYASRVSIVPVSSAYIPETIARTSELKTINGESIYGGGDITIEGGSLTESDIAAMGFTKNTGTYSKPSGGIPKSDLASAVQTSLGKADTALQSYTEQYKGTVTGVKMNGASKGSSGVVDLGNVATGVKINGSTKSPSSGVVDLGTVITSHQDISGKQDKLVSGTNIKTINGTSILGSGDITISGGGSGEDIRYFTEFTVEDIIEAGVSGDTVTYDTTELFNAMKSNKVICVPYRGYDKGFIVASYKSGENVEYPDMYLQKGDIEYHAYAGDFYELLVETPIYNSVQVVKMVGGEVMLECYGNHIYKITDPVDYLLVLPYNTQKGSTIHFVSGTNGTTLEYSIHSIFWANGEIPQIEPNTHYELSLMQNSAYENNAVLTPFKPVE